MHTNITPTKHRTGAAWKIALCLAMLFLLAWQIPGQTASADQLSFPSQAEIRPQTGQTAFFDLLSNFYGTLLAKATWVSVKDGFSLPIVQQPEGNPVFVSNKPDVITQFNTPVRDGVTGLLAHDFRSGKEFYGLKIGQLVTIYYAEDVVRDYQVVSISRFQKLDSSSVYSNLVDLQTHEELTSSQVYDRFYRGPHHVTFQTCLEAEGRLDWGLYFVIAEPIIGPIHNGIPSH